MEVVGRTPGSVSRPPAGWYGGGRITVTDFENKFWPSGP